MTGDTVNTATVMGLLFPDAALSAATFQVNTELPLTREVNRYPNHQCQEQTSVTTQEPHLKQLSVHSYSK